MLSFNFQNGLVKMLKECARREEKHPLKFLEVKHCNINSVNLQLISKLIAHNNGLLNAKQS